MKIILVDDDHLALEGMQQMLRWERFDGELCGCSTDGGKALALIKKYKPDVVISDIKMPGMDGIELSRYLYEHMCSIRMILISGHSEFAYAKQAIQYQVVDYILKPITRAKISELEERLMAINSELNQQKNQYLYAYTVDLREHILQALRTGNMEQLGELFTKPEVLGALSSRHHDSLGVQLLDYLFLYQNEIEQGNPYLQERRHQMMQEYWSLTSQHDRLVFLTTQYYDLMVSVAQRKSNYANPVIAYSQQIMQNNFHDPNFNISTLADRVHLTLSYLSTMFKQATGRNLSDYLTQCRMDHAKKLLADVSLPINQVCIQCGYEDPRYFAKAFKKHTNLTPSEFRNLYSVALKHENPLEAIL